MRGGHNKRATELKILEGKQQKDISPKSRPLFPVKPPKGMPKHAKEYWKIYAPKLLEMGLVKEIDVPAFEVLCLTYNTIKQCEAELQEKGILIPGARGQELVKNPASSILAQARQQFRLQCQSFGLDPQSRERLSVDTCHDPENEMERLLTRADNYRSY